MSDERQGRLQTSEFNSFILSLGSSAMYHMGEKSVDGKTNPDPNLPLAQHTINIIAMLEQKTAGNLSEEEAKLLSSLLYDLRMRFVNAQQKSG